MPIRSVGWPLEGDWRDLLINTTYARVRQNGRLVSIFAASVDGDAQCGCSACTSARPRPRRSGPRSRASLRGVACSVRLVISGAARGSKPPSQVYRLPGRVNFHAQRNLPMPARQRRLPRRTPTQLAPNGGGSPISCAPSCPSSPSSWLRPRAIAHLIRRNRTRTQRRMGGPARRPHDAANHRPLWAIIPSPASRAIAG